MSVGDGKRVVIVGAGLAGSLMACYLARLGYRVSVYERRGDPRKQGYSGGRSINLALSARGIRGLAGVDLAETVLKDAIPMRGRMMHAVSGATAFQAYSKDPTHAINSVSRGGLNLTLIEEAAKYENVELFFDHRCLDVDLDAPAVLFEHEIEPAREGTKAKIQVVRAEADMVIGADGAYSAVRGKMQKLDRFEYSQSYLEHGYKELQIPAASEGVSGEVAKWPSGEVEDGARARFALEPNALHIWPRGGSMMIALPNPDGSFTCTLFWPYEGRHGFEGLKTAEQVERFFREEYGDAVPLMPTLVEDYMNNPVGSLVTVRCRPWSCGGKVVLVGDAAHAIVPFYGQGMNCAFEDCVALAECLRETGGDAARALPMYEEVRKENADAIAEMALENFIEMRDKVASRAFRFRKKVEHALHAMFPRTLVPQYELVSFSTVPYVEAREAGRLMSRLIWWLGIAAAGLAGGLLGLVVLVAAGVV
jgi:kynurenine 3-monooxygenase